MSGETKFTPGPWSEGIERFATVFSAFGANDEDGHIVCDCYGPDARANAHLIAASPELYAENLTAEMVLREMANILEGSGLPGSASIARAHADNLATVAAKARGESQ